MSAATAATPAATRIAALKAEIEELDARSAALKLELNQLEKVPAYIDKAIKLLSGTAGKNITWQNKVRKILEEHLKSEPEYEGRHEYTKRADLIITNTVEYNWDGKKYIYSYLQVSDDDERRAYFGDDYYSKDASMGTDPYGLQDACVGFGSWKDLDDFDMKYLPVLIAYLEGEMPLDE